jgi:para-aminobenzoate synthetase component I
LRSSPIKGTARVASELLEKDQTENIMIVDLVRNDLGQVCQSGSVQVVDLLRLEEHPGLVHLVSDVEGTLPDGVGWKEILPHSRHQDQLVELQRAVRSKLFNVWKTARAEFTAGDSVGLMLTTSLPN